MIAVVVNTALVGVEVDVAKEVMAWDRRLRRKRLAQHRKRSFKAIIICHCKFSQVVLAEGFLDVKHGLSFDVGVGA